VSSLGGARLIFPLEKALPQLLCNPEKVFRKSFGLLFLQLNPDKVVQLYDL